MIMGSARRGRCRDVRAQGPETLARFKEPGRVVWYYRAVADALEPHAASVPLAELRAAIGELSALVEGAGKQPAAEAA